MSKNNPKNNHPADADARQKTAESAAQKADSLAADAAAEIDRALGDEQSAADAIDNGEAFDELMSIRAELDESKDRVLRLAAELENYRKRVTRQREDDLRYANAQLIRDMLPVLDNMQRAIEAAEKSNESESLLQGFQMVVQLMQGVLKQHHCETIEALHKPFDPHLHQAVCQQVSEEFPAGTVLVVVQDGYKLHDRVVRPSQVIVSKISEESKTEGNEGQ